MQDHLKILVVDNDPQERLALEEALRQYHSGAIFQEVMTCSEAFEAILSDQFDCILLNAHLPDGSGLSCLIEARKAGVTTPIILLAASSEDALAAESIDAGATVALPKGDLTPQLLDHCLRSALRFHKSQEQTRKAQEELRLRDRAIAAASSGIVICDPHQPDCPIIYCNPAFTVMTGYPCEEVMGRNCRFLQGPETDDQYVQQVRDCLREERDCQVILRNYRKDGTPFWNQLTISPMCSSRGHLTHFIGVQTDITERRDAEDALYVSVQRQQAMLRDVFASVTGGKLALCTSQDDLPPPLTWFAGPIPLNATDGVRALRQYTMRACLALGISDGRRYDLETAVGEAAMNAVVHAGTGSGTVFTDKRGIVQVWITDEGKGIAVANLPDATLRRGYSTAGTMGHGFKMMLMMVDRVHLLTGITGTTVVIEMDRESRPAMW